MILVGMYSANAILTQPERFEKDTFHKLSIKLSDALREAYIENAMLRRQLKEVQTK